MSERYNVLCIGVNKVPGKAWKELKYAEKNAAAVAEYFNVLKDIAHVTLLTGKDAAKPNIINWIEKCNASPEELNVILFFSGHASSQKNEDTKIPERCLWVHNGGDTGTDANRQTHPLKMPEVLKLLNNPLHRLIVIIDASYRIDSSISLREIFEEFKESERFISLKPYMIISDCAVNEYAFEDPALRHGVLTHYLLRTLSGKYTFFLQKKVALFKFLEILDKKVRTHRFITQTGRKRSLPMLMEKGVMAHFSSKGFKLPVLEPIPLVLDSSKNVFLQKISQLAHFLTCTRLRTKILLMGRLLGILLLLVYLVHISVVRIHFIPSQHAVLQDTLLGQRSYSLDKLDAQMVGRKYFEEFSLYRFKHNWVDALLRKLDEKGRIVLLGNLLGKRMTGVNEEQLLAFASKNSHDVFYWDPEDVMKLLGTIWKGYRYFDINRKRMTLELLAKLGKNGKTTALGISDFRSETDQGLRNLFLEHFYSNDFLKKNGNYFNMYDYLYLVKSNKQVPPSIEKKLKKETEKYLRAVADSIPGSHIEITDRDKLSEVYQKLEILASFGSHYFREKASGVFEKAFFPDEVIDLSWDCGNFQDKLWVLELFFKRVQHVNHYERVWERLVYRHIPNSTIKEKTGILKTILDTNLELIPKKYWNNLMLSIRYVDPRMVTLTDWENWLHKYHFDFQYIRYMLHWIIDKDYETVFPFLENHYEYFKNSFIEHIFARLYEFNKSKTVNLAKKIFEIGSEKDRLYAAVFLYNQSYPEYSAFIIEFLEKTPKKIYNQNLLKEFYGSINDAVIQLISNEKNLKKRLKHVLNHSKLFCRFFRTNMQFWPEQTIHRVLTVKIPKVYNDEGEYFLDVCERLPDEYRKKMLVKIFKADIYEDFRYRAESALAKHYPGEFLELVFNGWYEWRRYTRGHVGDAYQEFSYDELRDKLILNLRKESYWKVGFICEALLIKNKKDQGLNIEDIRYILKEFTGPLERIVLRELRYYLNKRQFLEVR
ncbi:MAG: hypothetical protein GTO45_18195 [Candidatus Aminicenantes bacterium]|nr:hypothetical protein [Candidatus Aminicenantes bacterium]NIM80719.1 hypothetical protein [Candidatus Aminicenantes bacterium]NIN20094.1 hypothetical protein [Candidatus Aminicenantes bacterium]NIN43881.1 hypothetical protein [Candidatus Aminicenantes bacterium]NIN86690.1 hypothetical protein [Candidatus Aminicenantes bacterium]